MLPVIKLQPLYHRGKENIALRFSFNKAIQHQIKQIKGIRWSRSHCCWYLPLCKDSYTALKQKVSGIAQTDTSELKQYLEQRKSVQPLIQREKLSKERAIMLQQHPLSENNLQAFRNFQSMLQLKGYSPNTFRTYSTELHCLLRLLGKVYVGDLGKEHICSYLLWLIRKKSYSEAHVHTAVNAIKFYFEQVEKRSKDFYDLPRPKKREQLPSILAEEEIVSLIQATTKLKHRVLLMASYSAGLRVSELVNLKMGDIDSKRMMIHIRQGKGKKDRMVPLSGMLLEALRSYYKVYRPKNYIFTGEREGMPYSTRSAQEVLKMAKLKAGIRKKGSIHSLRHSYATHLLEGGTDIRYIQAFLGHNDPKTTMRYTQVSKTAISNIKSPLDKLKL